jgi:predicted membrane-bound spermidine synthase
MKHKIFTSSPWFFYFIFFLSGFSGLIYESIWSHYLKLFLGHAAYAQTLVLVIYMGGMAIGAWGVGKFSINIKKVLLGYAIAEGLIGLFGVLFHSIFVGATDFSYASVIPKLGSSGGIELFKWTFASLIILPQSILLGTTFPLMTAGIIRNYPSNRGKSIASLYFLNSLGAAIGVLFSGFYLIDKVGLPGTVMTAGIINILIAVSVGAITTLKSKAPTDTPIEQQKEKSLLTNKSTFNILLLVSALTGLTSFMYEIGWIRMLNLVLGSSTHAFELMLSSFILGLAIGSLWIRNKIGKLKSVLKTLAIVQIAMGALAVLTLPLYNGTFNIMMFVHHALDETPEAYHLYNVFRDSIAMLIMLPPTIFAGMTLPLITYSLLKHGHGERSIGYVYGINTVGAIVGVIVAVHFIMPLFGLKNLIIIAGIIDIVIGLFLIQYFIPDLGKKKFAIMAVACSVYVLFFFLFVPSNQIKMASGVFRFGSIDRKKEVVFHKDGKTASVDVMKTRYKDNDVLTISTNGKPDASVSLGENITNDEITQTLLAAIPLALAEKVDSVAIIGMGSGRTADVFLNETKIKHLDVIEIEPAMVQGAKLFGKASANVFSDERCKINIDDAKTFFTRNRKKYDIILSEPSNVWVSGVASLFSSEFYKTAIKHLQSDGLLVQWMHLYESDLQMVASVIKAMSPYFEDYSIYFLDDTNIAIVAKPKGAITEIKRNIFTNPGMKKELNRIGLNNYMDILIRRLAGKIVLDPLFNSYPTIANSDYYPVLELRAEKNFFLKTRASSIYSLMGIAAPVIDVLENKKRRLEWTDIGPNFDFAKGVRVKQAIEIFNYYNALNKGEIPLIKTLMAENLEIIRSVNSIYYQRSIGELEKVWMQNVDKLMIATVAYLLPSQMEVIFDYIEKADVYADLRIEMRSKIDLYKAVVDRNYPEIINLTNHFLSEKEIMASQDNDYYMAVRMMSYIALGKKDFARKLWERYKPQKETPLMLRTLVCIAREGE